MAYRGRFAPSPTGPLHAGSLVAALGSWLDAKAHNGTWLVRIEDVDIPRCVPGADEVILQQLQACSLIPDEPPLRQSDRTVHYRQALDALVSNGIAYPCACSRKGIETQLQRHGSPRPRRGELVYPGTCRAGLAGREARAWRLRTDLTRPYERNGPQAHIERSHSATYSIADCIIHWHDRCLGDQQQNVAQKVGDFVLYRADGLFSYQLAVVVDDAAQGITHIVRGEDLADNTARQILLQRALHLPLPTYLHTPLVLAANGEKLSKQNGSQALDVSDPLTALNRAAEVLGLPTQTGTVAGALGLWVTAWRGKGF